MDLQLTNGSGSTTTLARAIETLDFSDPVATSALVIALRKSVEAYKARLLAESGELPEWKSIQKRNAPLKRKVRTLSDEQLKARRNDIGRALRVVASATRADGTTDEAQIGRATLLSLLNICDAEKDRRSQDVLNKRRVR
jgi:hypothetical protein